MISPSATESRSTAPAIDKGDANIPKQAYYAARAIDERRQARAATDARAAASHLELSARYEALAADPSHELPARGLANFEPSDQLPNSWNPTD
ncbi:MAG: hypothetical protein ABIW03_08230 [Sphingomicrobium sp.]